MLVNPKGGFYAEYGVANSDNAMHVPDKLTTEQAGVMLSDALTGLQGLDDVLALKRDETIMIFGAGGGHRPPCVPACQTDGCPRLCGRLR